MTTQRSSKSHLAAMDLCDGNADHASEVMRFYAGLWSSVDAYLTAMPVTENFDGTGPRYDAFESECNGDIKTLETEDGVHVWRCGWVKVGGRMCRTWNPAEAFRE